MIQRKVILRVILGLVFFVMPAGATDDIVVEGAPTDSGFQVGSQASFRVKLASGTKLDFKQVLVFADVSFVGTTAVSSAQLDLKSDESVGQGSRAVFEGSWLIPSEAPTGVYSVTLRVEDRSQHRLFSRQRIRGFAAYRKIIRIARATLDRTFYAVGQPILCEVILQNLSAQDAKGLRVEFSNANYPWISLVDKDEATGSSTQNPDLAIKVLRDQVNIPSLNEVTIPMSLAGQAAFLRGRQAAVLGSGGPARNEAERPPEVNSYTVAVWNADRTELYDMQFTTPVVVRAAGRERPWPYGSNFTHSYNTEIDFQKYREFYRPGQISPVITIDPSQTMYRPGDTIRINASVQNTSDTNWSGAGLKVGVADSTGKVVHSVPVESWLSIKAGEVVNVNSEVWAIPADSPPGMYQLKLWLATPDGRLLATAAAEIAINRMPAALMVFNAHPDDEVAYGGLIRAAVEAGVPVRVVFFTSGDVGFCERYYAKACGPNEAREFGLLRMEESADALAHLGVPRDNLIFLGLPDGGSGTIWFQHDSSAKPFRSIYLGTDHAPYENIFKPNLAYARESVMDATKQIIADFHPSMIITTHPDERHVDHRTANWFVVKACQELLREQRIDSKTQILANISYGAGGSKPAPYHYENYRVYLSGEVAAKRQEMNWFYQSQHGNQAEGNRKDYSELTRTEEHLRILDWQKFGGWNEKPQ